MSAALAYAAGLAGLYALSALASIRFFDRRPPDGPAEAFTVIRPLRGLDEGLERNLRALLEADVEGRLQVLFAVESPDDPAYAVANRAAAGLPEERARVLVTGRSSSERMGKMHNMIEALRHARHEWVVFCDSDARPDRALLLETSRAIRERLDAFCALPDAAAARRLPELLVALAFNQYFVPAVVLQYRLGLGCLFSGAWMGFRRSCLERIGGLERFSLHAADDFALSEAAQHAGARVALLPRHVALYESGGGLREGLEHLVRWARVARSCVPARYALLPLLVPAAPAAVAAWSAPGAALPLWLGLSALRAAHAWAVDAAVGRERVMPAWSYPLVPVADLACVLLWASGWLGATVEWRGRKYRLRGGRFEPG